MLDPALARLSRLAPALAGGEVELLGYLGALEEQFAAVEPEVLAFVPEPGRFERLRRQARELLGRWPQPGSRPPLFGVPVGVKDIFHVDGLPTRAGSRLPAEALAGPQSAVVTALLQAGALVLGKTVTTELATFTPGPTRNPRNPAHTPGGSSSGSAAAVAAGLAPLTVGSQTLGSVGRPAAFCGVVGFKASFGRLPSAGMIPLAPSLDHPGLFTAEADGAALAATQAVADFKPAEVPQRPILGIPEGPYLEQASTPALARFRASCRQLATAGYEVRAVPALANIEVVNRRSRQLFNGEGYRVHREWYERHGELYRPPTRELLEAGRQVTEEELAAARQLQEATRRRLTALMDRHQLDFWLSPAAPGPAPRGLAATGDPVMNIPWTCAGLPTLVLPAGSSDEGLPLGLQLAARFGADERLLAWGPQLETDLE